MEEVMNLIAALESSESDAVIASTLNKLGFAFLVYGHDYVLNGDYYEVDSYTGDESMSRYDVSLIYCEQEPQRDFSYRQEVSASDINELKYLHYKEQLSIFINDEWISI
jgi:hypothetical protein